MSKVNSSYIGEVIVIEGRHKGKIGYCDDFYDYKFIDIKTGQEIDDDILELLEEDYERLRLEKGIKEVKDGPYNCRFVDIKTGKEVDDLELFQEDYERLRLERGVRKVGCGAIYFGQMLMALNSCYEIPYDSLKIPTLSDLLERYNDLSSKISSSIARDFAGHESYDPYEVIAWFQERDLAEGLLTQAIIEGRDKKINNGKKIFLSHSKKDAPFVRMLHDELTRRGHSPWMDEYDIKVGDSIPGKISTGVKDSDYVVVVLTENAITSNWVEREWMTKYWDEVQQSKVSILPILLEPCEIPELLKTKKYADFSQVYNHGLAELLIAIEKG